MARPNTCSIHRKSQKETCCRLLPDYKPVHSPGCLSPSADREHARGPQELDVPNPSNTPPLLQSTTENSAAENSVPATSLPPLLDDYQRTLSEDDDSLNLRRSSRTYSGFEKLVIFPNTIFFRHTNELRNFALTTHNNESSFICSFEYVYSKAPADWAIHRFKCAARLVVFRLVGCLRRNGLARC